MNNLHLLAIIGAVIIIIPNYASATVGDLLDSFDEVKKRIESFEKSLYRHNVTVGHSPYWIPAKEIDAYSKDILLYSDILKNNKNTVLSESDKRRVDNLFDVCFAHENYGRFNLPFEWEKKLENCDIFKQSYQEYMRPSEEILNERDYRDKQ